MPMRALFGCLLMTAMALAISKDLHAHDWYPHECCHGDDCAPVDNVAKLAGKENEPQLVVTSKHGTAVLPTTLPWRKSHDHRMHVCMRPSLYGGMGVTCIFMPQPMY
jgi:hypothetical protein